MWNALKEKDRNTIKEICEYFIPKFPEIKEEIIKERIFNGYCWGEGCLSHIVTIEDWNIVFFGSGLPKDLLTCFNDWEDYIKHDCDFHNKLDICKRSEHQ